MKKIALCLLSAALLFALSVTAFAAEVPDPARTGSVTFQMDWEGEPLNSGSLTLYRVGLIRETAFVLTEELADSGVSLDDLEDSELPLTLAELAMSEELEPISAGIAEGTAVFPELMPGLYVVTQKEACEGFATIRPFLISLPRWDGEAYLYDLTAQPKVPLETEPTEPSEPTEPTEPTEPGEPGLPQTGQLNWPVSVMAASGLAFLVLGFVLCFGKRRHHEN